MDSAQWYHRWYSEEDVFAAGNLCVRYVSISSIILLAFIYLLIYWQQQDNTKYVLIKIQSKTYQGAYNTGLHSTIKTWLKPKLRQTLEKKEEPTKLHNCAGVFFIKYSKLCILLAHESFSSPEFKTCNAILRLKSLHGLLILREWRIKWHRPEISSLRVHDHFHFAKGHPYLTSVGNYWITERQWPPRAMCNIGDSNFSQ